VHRLGEDARSAWRGRNVGVVFQFFQLLPTLTVVQNVMLPMDFAGRYSLREQKERALRLLDQVGIAEHAHKLPSAMSGGQQQRIAIARALACDPPVLLADEPTGSLDFATGERVMELMFEMNREAGTTLVLVTHDNAIASRCDRQLHLEAGRLTPASGAPTALDYCANL
jgi:putative ABC transport system ATP-binding protein